MTLLGSNSEVWDEATFFCPSLCHSSHFSLFILLKLHSLHLPLPCPHTSSLLLPTLLSFHLISPSLPFLIPLHIYSAEQLLICPLVPHTLLHCPLSPCLSIAPLFPSCPFCNSSLFYAVLLLPSSSERCSHLVCWNALFSFPWAGINHNPFHTWQSMLYASDVYICC